MAIVDQIKNNEITTLHLSEPPEDYFDDCSAFASAMEANTSITKVIFDKEFLSCAIGKERAVIVSSIGALPNAKVVELKDSLLMVGVCVTNLVKNSKSLEELSMENCLLQGLPDDFEKLKDGINCSSTIKNLRIHDCTAPSKKVDLNAEMNSLKAGLSIAVSGEGARIKQ
jgi:hypothetical protein